jgi:TetR/AcrR family transcriptional repressor of nem operon
MVATPRSLDTRTRLLEAGLVCFSARGFHGTGIQEIVAAAGIPKGSFYNHYPSKEDFGAAIIRHYGEAFLRQWGADLEGAEGPSPLATLRQSYEFLIDAHEGCQPKVGCLLGNLAAEIGGSSPACQAALASVIAVWRDRFTGYLRRGQALGEVRTDVEAEALAAFFWCAWEGSLLAMKIQGSTEPVRQCLAFLFNDVFPPRG